jgi:putative serine protease PepD
MTDDEHSTSGDADDLRPATSGGRPSPAGRPWVHPSELPVFDGPPWTPGPGRRRHAVGAAVRTLTTPVLSGLFGAALALAVAAAIGAFDRPSRIQVIERASESSASTAVPTTTDDPERVAAVARQAMPALVQVKLPPDAGGAVGTGLTLSADGLVVTSADLVGSSTDLEIVDSGGRTHTAKVVGTDPESGLAVLRADADDLIVADLADAGPSQVGETAIVVGAPSGWQTTGSVAVGVISGINRVVVAGSEQVLSGMLSIDRPIPSSACGGAVLDLDGKVVAVPVSWPRADPASDSTGVTAETLSSRSDDGTSASAALAVPIDQVKAITQQIVDDGHVEHAWLGVAGHPLSAPAATRMGVGGGVDVTIVNPDSPAALADIRVGDVVTAVDGVAIADMPSLLTEVRSKGVGATITLTIMRMGTPDGLSVQAKLVDKPHR